MDSWCGRKGRGPSFIDWSEVFAPHAEWKPVRSYLARKEHWDCFLWLHVTHYILIEVEIGTCFNLDLTSWSFKFHLEGFNVPLSTSWNFPVSVCVLFLLLVGTTEKSPTLFCKSHSHQLHTWTRLPWAFPLQAEQIHISQPFLIGEMLQSPHHICHHPLDLLQELHLQFIWASSK